MRRADRDIVTGAVVCGLEMRLVQTVKTWWLAVLPLCVNLDYYSYVIVFACFFVCVRASERKMKLDVCV